ncbi:MAG: undecaprenyldiphospho-muramoylpentapeptide beta-N-acetylglucosaminyltransferase [Betaproteobacteria bacterium AqS2]|uniref:UDP-N-acetylglucosamine--N-acetylmuramyl-(pentapeptide) pyrophosphoryl-undecaprenol N-acetylglucosamine transferase n=1 Tax=Candidatus Amphirhobacter heronislandensis TaxID=1732024 RepID=A0A930UHK5_9GAMM|nr:undecaprenyldiphospho-muramoylpentapeptide beta-N-acetylglucosaminyltransferase [Betaproteobacteria bacterium AqS2]
MSGVVVICGGGTGGHINPGLAVAKRLRELDVAVAWLGLRGGLEERLVSAAGVDLHTVDLRPAASAPGGRLGLLLRLPAAVADARRILRELDAGAVLGLGGYPSLPGMLASFGLRARRLLHEQNALPGIANRLLAPVVHAILASQEGSFAGGRVQVTGNPVRAEFAGQPAPAKRLATSESMNLLVLGGSQGANSLNQGVPRALGLLPNKDGWKVEHAAGAGGAAAVEAAYQEQGVKAEVADYFDDAAARMARAHMVVCRAGASTVAEVACLGVAAVFVPYPHAGGHQRANAAALVHARAARLLEDRELRTRPAALAGVMKEAGGLVELFGMAERARALGRPDAAAAVAEACVEQLGHV